MKKLSLTLSFTLLTALSSTSVLAKYSTGKLNSAFTSWGINSERSVNGSIKLEGAWKKFQKRKNVVVAVVDTGVDFNHPFLRSNLCVVKKKRCITNSKLVNGKNYGVDFSSGVATATPNDTHGHGTHVSGIVKSIFPEVKILALKYYNPNASGYENLEATIKALKYAVDMNVDIINYSGGGPEPSAQEFAILKEAEKKGILVIAAAGNERSNIDQQANKYYPASYGLSNIVTVAAHDKKNHLIAASNFGNKSVDIAAPGDRIRSAIPGSAAGKMTGTRQATAFVTGVAALIKSQYGKLNFKHIKNIIVSSSTNVPSLNGKVLGGGKLNATKALETASKVNKRLFPYASRRVAKQN